jgi:hypothetical protein
MKSKLTFINILVLSFYLFYALSPLMYSLESAQADEQSGNLPGISLTKSQPSVADQNLLLTMSPKEDEDSSSGPVSRVLLKKKKAVSASFKSIIGQLSLCCVKFLEFAPSSEIATIATRIPGDRPICPHGFQLCHSGISPPSA